MEILPLRKSELFIGLFDLTAEIVRVVRVKIVLSPPCVLLETIFIRWGDDLNWFRVVFISLFFEHVAVVWVVLLVPILPHSRLLSHGLFLFTHKRLTPVVLDSPRWHVCNNSVFADEGLLVGGWLACLGLLEWVHLVFFGTYLKNLVSWFCRMVFFLYHLLDVKIQKRAFWKTLLIELTCTAWTDVYMLFRFGNTTEPFLEGLFMTFFAPRPVQNGRHWRLLIRRVNIEDFKMFCLCGYGLNVAAQWVINQGLRFLRHDELELSELIYITWPFGLISYFRCYKKTYTLLIALISI